MRTRAETKSSNVRLTSGTHAAWSVGEQDDSGSIEVGKRADLTAFAIDPVIAPPDELVDAPIVLTVSDGAITHEALIGAAWS